MACKHMVILGASAGGIESLKVFFDHTPLDETAYFILTHVPYDYQTQLAPILQLHSQLQMIEAVQGMTVDGNNVYTLPLNGFMRLQEGKLTITRRLETEGSNHAVDYFLRSLLQECNSTIIVVILSGVGRDGSSLLSALHHRGAQIIAQLPSSCSYDGMPKNAINTGFVDYILLPKDMPACISRLAAATTN